METKIKDHKVRLGDVFLQKDGWGLIITKPVLESSTVFSTAYINSFIICPSHTHRESIDKIKIKDTDIFLFNICDIFSSAKDAMKEQHENSSD